MGMGTMLTWEQMLTKTTVNRLHPEVLRRFNALIHAGWEAGVPLGVGTGWRVQPDPPPAGFAQPGQQLARVLPGEPGECDGARHRHRARHLVGLDVRPLPAATGCAPSATSTTSRGTSNRPRSRRAADYATTMPALVHWELPG